MKRFLFDCTASLGNLHREIYHIAVFTPKTNAESAEYLPYPVQYYRRFIYSKILSKNRWFVPNCSPYQNPHKHWGFVVKIELNLSESGLSQNVIETSFLRVRIVPKMYAKPPFCSFKICAIIDKEKSEKIIAF